MFTRSLDDVAAVEWGNGLSYRLLTKRDGMGFAVADTLVRKGTSSALQYRNHLEACYCIGGSGEVVEKDGTRHKIVPGTIYVLDQHDPHYLLASPDEDLHLVSIFNPPINGDEKHTLSEDGFSQY
ncbi:L-ectoine synthase [Kitasatospora sp. SolWspMP-SS2h]|uniref:ectoine synthase n=1 Tax=Kitasatospora sp. SolWspMP-SS2h TaxID=1305729 RepID=UPI000DB992E8|nr:ectoine synthase [Kitasatospora sp. SolWspMP-SS2h]RAJ45673.1 L-ectoine synthase [Kitasatospora sp. SolWspMP-SS2h]